MQRLLILSLILTSLYSSTSCKTAEAVQRGAEKFTEKLAQIDGAIKAVDTKVDAMKAQTIATVQADPDLDDETKKSIIALITGGGLAGLWGALKLYAKAKVRGKALLAIGKGVDSLPPELAKIAKDQIGKFMAKNTSEHAEIEKIKA